MSIRRLARILLFMVTVLALNPYFQARTASASSGSNLTSDEAFFGIWNPTAQTWTAQGKLNYAYNSSMTAIGNLVKQVQDGDYSAAKTALLDYYRNRTDRTVPALTMEDGNPVIASLTYDDYYYDTGYGERYRDTVSLSDEYASVAADVYLSLNTAYSGNKQQVSFMLMGSDKNGIDASFYSKENSGGSQAAQLIVQYEGGTQQTFAVSDDTYIRPGDSADTNFGGMDTLLVQDSGNATLPYDDQTKRAYLKFDLTGLSDLPVVSATLRLFGKAEAGTTDVMVLEYFDSTWSESLKTWNNTRSSFFSWKGIPSLTTWDNFDGTDIAYYYDISRFNFAVPMAYEYAVNGNNAYAAKLIDIMMDFIGDKGAGYPRALETGLRDPNWITAYHYIKSSPDLDSQENTEILKFLEAEGEFLTQNRNFNDSTNIGTANAQGLYTLAVYFPEFQSAPDWQDLAEVRLNYLLQELNYPDHSYKEASTGYDGVTVKTLDMIMNLGLLNGQQFSDEFKKTLSDMALYFIQSNYPNGYQTQYGNTDVQQRKNTILSIGNNLGNNDLIYFGSGGQSGTEPDIGSSYYPDGKMVFMRTGWTPDDLYLHLNNKHGYHGNFDDLSILPYAYGRPLLVDPGRFSYTVGDPVETWLNSTEAHNTVEINHQNQYQFTNSSQNDWTSNDLFDFYEGSTDGYIRDKLRHTRSVLFLKPNYWIVSDYIDAVTNEDVNHYNQTWHFAPSDNPTYDSVTQSVYSQSGQAELQIVPVNDPGLSLTMQEGYYASKYGTVTKATYASYVKEAAGDVSFDTVLYPTPAGVHASVQTSRLPLPVPPEVASALYVDLGTQEKGYYYISHEANATTQRQFGSYLFNGKMAYVGEDGSGHVASAMLRGGTSLSRNRSGDVLNLVKAASPLHDLGLQWNDASRQVSISGPVMSPAASPADAVAVYAPSSYTTIALNGVSYASSSFGRNGDYVYVHVEPVPAGDSTALTVGYTADYDFNTDDSGFPPSNWITKEYAGTAQVVDDTVNFPANGQVVKLDKTSTVSLHPELSSGVEVSAMRVLPVLKGPVTVEMDVRTDETSGSKQININDDVGVGGVTVLFNNGTIQAYVNGGYFSLQNFSANTWYHFKLVLDTSSSRYDLYIDGQKQVAQAYLRNPIYNVGQVYYGMTGSTIGTLYMDNIKVYQITATVLDTFDHDTEGSAPTGWSSSTQNGSVAVAHLNSRIDKSVRLMRSSSTEPAATATRNFPLLSGKVTVEARIRTDNAAVFKSAPYIYDASNNPAVSLAVSNGKLRSFYNNVWNDIQSVNNNQWYQVKVEIDTAADTADVSVDGIKRLTAVPLRTAVDNLKSMRFDLSSTNTGSFYFDDVKVYPTPQLPVSPDPLTAPILAAEQFNQDVVGEAPSNWTISTGSGTGSSVTVREFPDASDKSMLLDKPDGVGTAHAALPLNRLTGKVSVDASVYIGSVTGTVYAPILLDSSGNQAVAVVFDQGDIKAQANGTWQTLQAYDNGSWYRNHLALDTDNDVFTLAVNDTEMLYKVGFQTPVSDMDALRFEIPDGSTGSVYIDNVIVRKTVPTVLNNFDSDTVGAEPAAAFTVKAGSDVQIVDQSGNRSVKISKSAAPFDVASGFSFFGNRGGGLEGTVRVSFKVKSETAGKKSVYLYDDNGVMTARLLLLNGVLQAYDGTALRNVKSFANDTWISVDFVINTITDTYQLYVNGVVWNVATTPSVRTEALLRTPIQALSSIRFTVQNADSGTLYFDDINVD